MAEQALDPKTRVLLYKLVNGGVLDSVNGVISTGKVLHGLPDRDVLSAVPS